MKPIKLSPVFKNYLWGGEKLKEIYPIDTDLPLAEAWLLSSNKDGESILDDNNNSSKTFSSYLRDNKNILGENCKDFLDLPVLIKLIDAKENLSVQVHPDDEFAKTYEDSLGKTEMWYVLSAQEGAFIYYGLKEDTKKEDFINNIKSGDLENLLNKVYTKEGDVFYLPSGTIHAIGAGNLIAEIQQNSNITYRLFDYKRKDKNGDERELHVKKGSLVSNLKKTIPHPLEVANYKIQPGAEVATLINTKYFKVKRVDVETSFEGFVGKDSFISLVCTEGEGEIIAHDKTYPLHLGDSYFLPANMGNFKVRGQLFFLLTSI